jgi:hypothetical protein
MTDSNIDAKVEIKNKNNDSVYTPSLYEKLRHVDDIDENIKPLLVDQYQLARYKAFLDGIDWIIYEQIPGNILEFGVASGVTTLFLTLALRRCLHAYGGDGRPHTPYQKINEKNSGREDGGDKNDTKNETKEDEKSVMRPYSSYIFSSLSDVPISINSSGGLGAVAAPTIIGFDSFEGLPENNHPRWPKGIFKDNRSHGHPTLEIGERVTPEKILEMFDKCKLPRPYLVKGLFNLTLARSSLSPSVKDVKEEEEVKETRIIHPSSSSPVEFYLPSQDSLFHIALANHHHLPSLEPAVLIPTFSVDTASAALVNSNSFSSSATLVNSSSPPIISSSPPTTSSSFLSSNLAFGGFRGSVSAPCALVHIDCDLYEACLEVLNGIKHLLQQGTLIYFDDWNNYKGDRMKGERRAVKEFLAANPHIEFEDHLTYTAFCKSFIVHIQC